MSYFDKELWAALSRPFKLKEDGENRKWVQVLGSLLDDARESVLEVRRQWYTRHAHGWVLDLRGAERKIYRWYGESDEDYRKRIDGAFALYAAGGTLPGMRSALLQIGYGDVKITERSPTWARFMLEFDFPITRPMGRREWDILNFSVFKMKPAHTLPLYWINFRPEPPQQIVATSKPRIDGEITASHAFWWSGKRFYYIDGSLTLNGSITLGDGWCEAVYLDGEKLLDGNCLLDSFTAVSDDGWRWIGNPLHRPNIVGEIGPIRPFANQVYRLDGRELLNGELLLDALKETNTKLGHHRAYVERFDDQGNSLGREAL